MTERSLARFDYYIVFIAMLVLAAVGIVIVLNTLLGLTPLPVTSRHPIAPRSRVRCCSRPWPGPSPAAWAARTTGSSAATWRPTPLQVPAASARSS